MFDRDISKLYGVKTMVLNQAVKRNKERFPDDFMFQLNKSEMKIWKSHPASSRSETDLISQSVISSWGGTRKPPYVFTEQGVMMLSAVLKSGIAVEVSIQIVRVFVKMREMLATHKELRDKIEKMEKENKENFQTVFRILSKFMATDKKSAEVKVTGFTDKR